jgi:protease-4
MAKLTSYQLKEYPESKTMLEKFLNKTTEDVKVKAIKEEIGEEQYIILKQLKNIRNMVSVPQTRLPFELTIR